MQDNFHKLIKSAEELFAENKSSRILISWNIDTEDFVLHDLTYTHNTYNYFSDWSLCPLFFIIPAHIKLFKDPSVLLAVSQGWHTIINTIVMPPCSTAITLPINPNHNGA